MQPSLTASQLILLRRCDGGLRVFETGPALTALLADLAVLNELRLVVANDANGHELTPSGEICLTRLGR